MHCGVVKEGLAAARLSFQDSGSLDLELTQFIAQQTMRAFQQLTTCVA
jgi:hypothetical protein